MNPLFKTVAGLGTGWIASRSVGLVSRLQAGHGETTAKKVQNRRTFTRNAALGASAVVLANIGIAFGQLMWPHKTGAFGGQITVGADNIPEPGGEPFRMQEGKFYIVRNDDGIQALYWKCVHLAAPCRGRLAKATSTAHATVRSSPPTVPVSVVRQRAEWIACRSL